MNSTHGNREKAAKHLQQPRQIVPGNLGLSFRRRVPVEPVRRFVAWSSVALAYL